MSPGIPDAFLGADDIDAHITVEDPGRTPAKRFAEPF